jgi:hypothetical protein
MMGSRRGLYLSGSRTTTPPALPRRTSPPPLTVAPPKALTCDLPAEPLGAVGYAASGPSSDPLHLGRDRGVGATGVDPLPVIADLFAMDGRLPAGRVRRGCHAGDVVVSSPGIWPAERLRPGPPASRAPPRRNARCGSARGLS